jgi:tetratricopeptide (TPR) repeat protein
MNNSLPEIWNCPEAFEFICTKKWDGLTPTDLENVRHCDTCNEHVYWSANPEEFVANSTQGRCVAVPKTGMLLGNDLSLTGRVSPEYYQNRAIHVAEYQLWRSGWNLILNRDPFFILFLIRKGYPDALELYIELATKFPEDRELTRRAHILLARFSFREATPTNDRQKFALYLLKIGRIDEAIAIARSTQDPSICKIIIGELLNMNLVTEAQKLLPTIDSSSYFYYCSLGAIAEKMSELGQSKQAIDLYEGYLTNITNNFKDIESQISNRLPALYLLDTFVNLATDFPDPENLVDRANTVLADDESRKKFLLYLLNSKKTDGAVAIAKTFSHDSNLLKYIVSRFSDMNEVEAALEIISIQTSGQAQFDGLKWIISRLQSARQIDRAIDVCQWYLTNIQNIPAEIEAEVVRQISSLRSSQ